MKKLTNFFNCEAKELLKTGGGTSQCQTSRSEGARQMTTMLEGATIQQPFSIHSAPFGTTRIPRGWKYAACLLLAFFVGVGNVWGTDPLDTYYKFTKTYSSNDTIRPKSGDGGVITLGSNSAAKVTASTAFYLGNEYSYAININNTDAKAFSLPITASTENPAHVFVLVTSDNRTLKLKYGSSEVDQCGARGTAGSSAEYTKAAALVELTTTNSGNHIIYATNSALVYAVRVVYEKNTTWQAVKNLTSATLDKDKTLADNLAELLFFRMQDLRFNANGVIPVNNSVANGLRYSINFKAQKNGTVTVNYANPGSSTRTLTVTEFTRPTTAGTSIVSKSVSSGTTAYTDQEFNVTAGKEYVISFGSGATFKSVNFTAACTSVSAPTSLAENTEARTVNSLTYTWTKADHASGYTATLYSNSGCTSEVESKELGDVATVTFNTGLSASTNYWCKVQSKGNGTTYCAEGGVTSAAQGTTAAPSCGDVTAPTQLQASSITTDGATFTITDGADAFNYELYVSESSTAPEASADATYTSTAKSKEVTGLTSGTTYYAWVRAVCDADHKSSWVALSGSSFKVRTTPTASFADAEYVIGASAIDVAANFSSNSEAAVVYELKEDYSNVTLSGSMFSATVAGEYVVVANQAGNATYTSISKEATITVVPAPTHLVENRLNVTSGDWSSTIYTNDGTNISNLVQWQIAAGQDRTAGVTDKQSIKNSRTHGIGTTSEKVDGYYMYLSFKVADGKRLKLSAVNIPVFGISHNKTTEVEIADAYSNKITVNGTITHDADGNGFGTYTFSEAPYLKGVVTMKMWAYGATSGYRMTTPIYLDGTISNIPATYAVTYAANGGTSTMTDSNSPYEAGAEVTLLDNAFTAPSGNIFDGWVVTRNDNSGTVTVTNGKFTMPASAVTVTAQWASAHTVSFAANGGGSSMASVMVKDGTTYTIPACEYTAPTDYEFSGWSIAGVDGKIAGAPNETFTMPAGDVTLTAQWVAVTPGYYVTYNGSGNEGGTVPVDADKHESGATVTVLGNTGSMTKTIGGESAAFHGWNTNSDMSGGTHYEAEETFDMPDAAVTLYAVWGFALNYDADGGTINDASYATWYISTGAESSINTPLPSDVTKDGYVFDGWYTENGSGSKVTEINASNYGDFSGDWKLKAKWTEAPKTVSFNMNDHGAAITAQDVMSGGTATAPFVADVDGWVFGGWYTDAECTAGNEFSFSTTISADRTLYAKWTADACSSERKSLSKVVLTAADDGTVSGYNDGEYAGSAVIDGLSGTQTAEVDGSHEGVETGYKMNGKGSAIVFATLKKGTFQEGDKVVFTITKKNDVRAVDEDKNILTIYYGTNASDATELTTIKGVSAAGTYTYRLTAADVTAIGSKKGIGLFRVSGDNGQNPYVYSVEITGCRNWTIMRTVSFDMKDHGSAIADVPVEDGEKISAPAEPEAAGYLFQGWYKETTLENEWDFANDVVEADITLYAKWVADPCSDRQSLSKVVLTSASDGTVTGYNSNEYAGEKVIASLSGTADEDIIGDATKERGYKLSSGGNSIVFATLAKGNFQEGDKVTVGITKINDTRTVAASTAIMTIYAGSDKDHTMEVTTLTGVSAPGFYTYRLTAADATAINTAGYKSIGLFRASSNGENHHVYSVEITGCRDWSVSHNVTFNMHDHGSAIASQSVYEGGKVTKPAVVEPEGWAFDGWYKESTYENEWDFDLDVMGTSDIELHAKWESEAGVIKLFDGEGNLNTTNFVSPAKTTIEIDEVEYPCLAEFSSNRTSLAGATPSDMVQYNATTDEAKIKMTFYNSNSGVKKAILYKYEEGAEEPVKIEIEVPGQTIFTTDYYTFNSSKNRSFYVCMNDRSNIRVLQLKVMDNGTAIQQAGQAGYSLNFNKGRMYVKNGTATTFEGMTMNTSSDYKVFNNSNIATTSNFSFTTTVNGMILRVTRAGGNYYVSQDPASKGTIYNKNQEIVLTPAGTWYIGSETSGSAASFSKIEFIAPKCEAPAFNALANSDICSGDPYVALDGTGTVSDGGSITYKWYAEDDAETVLATTATYMPIADGSYYVVALHHVDGYTDNEVTSDVVTVTTHAGTAISEPLADQRGNVDDVVALEVVASGKNLHYAWKECATIDGEYTAVAGAADAASLDVTITEGMDKYYKVIVSSDCGDAQESVAHVTQYVPVAQANVTGSIAWDWANAASVSEIKLTTTSTPKKNEGFVMANGAATIYNNANFESDKLYLEGEYIVRDGDKANPYFQGQTIKFNTTVAGAVRVKFSHTGNATEDKPARELYINGVATGEIRDNATAAWSGYIEVPAGEVSITAYYVDPADGAGQQYIRVPEIEFYALDQVRDDSWIAPGELGTVCYPNGHIVVGADMYQMAGVDENHKFAFDQVTVTEPGVPYLFEATGYDPIKFYKTTAAAAAEAGTSNGMVGTFVAKTLSPAEGENLYYFQGTHFYSVADRTKNLSVPANRCYVDLNEPHPAAAPAPGRRRITFGVNGTNTATGVENIQTTEISIQKVLIDGKMYILRGEKMYDATGRLVK